MITFTQGNLLEARAEALVNTVNTVGVMGKGIALMFKERFADNFRLYSAACKAKEVQTGRMFVTSVPVSYTHLDVYKRQPRYRRATSGAAPHPCR